MKEVSMKQVIFFLVLGLVNVARATTITCSGSGKVLTTQFNAKTTGRYMTELSFGDVSSPAQLPGQMAVDVQFNEPGTVSINRQINSYSGIYNSGEDSIGFWVTQAFDLNGKYLYDVKNVFGMNRKALGDCKVTE